ncbi:MAG: extracellular solute-binding protein [Ktedonobacteraceae bacterium]
MQTTLSRRRFLQQSAQVTFATSATAALLAACGGETTSSSTTKTTIVFWHTYNVTSAENQTLVKKVIPAFNKKFPNITVHSQDIPYDSMLKKLIASVAGGNGPDLIRSDIIWMPQLAKIGALASTDDIVAQRKSEFYPGPLATCSYQGKYYGLPLDTNTRIVFYNKDLFARAGLSKAPTTAEEFKAAAAKIRALGQKIYGYAEGGLGGWNMLPWVWSFGGAVTDASYTKATGYINGSNSVAALEFLLDLYKNHTLSPTILGGSGLATSDAIGKNQVGMIIDGPWMPPIFKSTYPNLQYDFALMPAGPSGQSVSVVGGEDIAIMKASKHVDAAREFMQFMTSAEAQVLMGTTGQMPVLKSVADDPQLPSYFKTFSQQLQTANPRPVSPNYSKIDTVFTDAFNRAFRNLATPQAALDSAATQIDALLQS